MAILLDFIIIIQRNYVVNYIDPNRINKNLTREKIKITNKK